MEKALYKSPLGWIEICTNTNGVTHIYFIDAPSNPQKDIPFLDLVVQQLDNYFIQESKTFFFFPCDPSGTDFQLEVWRILHQIPHGTTLPYLKIAQKFGDIKKVRAIASAISKNPILIAIPCHRVIGSDRSLVGYSGGLERKRKLWNWKAFQNKIPYFRGRFNFGL